MSNHMLNLIQAALGAVVDSNLQKQAESQFMDMLSKNPSSFFFQLADILVNQRNHVDVRRRAGVLISRCLCFKNNNNGKFYWDQIYADQKRQFKNKMLNILISNSAQIMRAGASVIAAIAAIELPRQEWQDIIDSLADHCTNNNMNIKIASITTLGYICQQIKRAEQKINHRLSQQILGSIIVSTRESDQSMIKTSLKALQDSLSFLSQMMSDSRYRDTVFNVFISQFQKGNFKEETYAALYEFVKICGMYLSNYEKQLLDLAEVHLELRDQAATLNLQLWDIIASQYAQMLSNQRQRVGNYAHNQINFLQSVSEKLLPMVMKNLLIIKKSQEDDQNAQQRRMSAAKVLQGFVKVCDKKVVDKIINSVSMIIDSNDPYQRQASVVLFATITQYPDKDLALELCNQAFQSLFNLLNVESKVVVKNSLIGFVHLSESLPEVFLLHSNVKQIIEVLYGFVNVNNNDIRYVATLILSNISQGLKDYPHPVADDPEILLTKVVSFYTANQLQADSEQKVINEKFAAMIMNLVMNTNKRDIILQLIEFMIDKYYEVINADSPNHDKFYVIEQVLSVLHTAILAHKNSIPNNEILGKICDLMNKHFTKYGIEQQGLSLLGAVCTTFNKSFEYRSTTYWQSVMHGLSQSNELPTFKAALSCIGDYARMTETGFFNNANLVMTQLLDYIKGNLDRQLKIHIINCMGDLILSLQQFAESYVDDILQISDICFQAIYQMAHYANQSDYVDELKQSLIDMYSCCVFAVNHTKPSFKLYSHFGNLATFVVRTCDPNLHPTVDYLKGCLYLIYDSAAFYWNVQNYHSKIKEISQSSQIMTLVKSLDKYSNRSDIKELLEFIQSRRRV